MIRFASLAALSLVACSSSPDSFKGKPRQLPLTTIAVCSATTDDGNDGSIETRTTYVYDIKGDPLEATTVDALTGALISVETFTYGDDHELLAYAHDDGDTLPEYAETWDYDERGRSTRYTLVDRLYTPQELDERYTYDGDSLYPSAIERRDPEGELVLRYEYTLDDQGRWSEMHQTFPADGQRSGVYTYEDDGHTEIWTELLGSTPETSTIQHYSHVDGMLLDLEHRYPMEGGMATYGLAFEVENGRLTRVQGSDTTPSDRSASVSEYSYDADGVLASYITSWDYTNASDWTSRTDYQRCQ
jgi:hypothetical protein